MKYGIIVADPPWSFDDKLKQSSVKRGAEANYNIMSDRDIINLDIKSISNKDAILGLWVPGSKLDIGMETAKSWGFSVKQVFVWVKTKQNVKNIENCLSFGMGHYFRQTHEIALVCSRGKTGKLIKNKSQRSVMFAPAMKHSKKPEGFQDSLELMVPEANKLELFARRDRNGWECVGNESSKYYGEDIAKSIEKIKLFK